MPMVDWSHSPSLHDSVFGLGPTTLGSQVHSQDDFQVSPQHLPSAQEMPSLFLPTSPSDESSLPQPIPKLAPRKMSFPHSTYFLQTTCHWPEQEPSFSLDVDDRNCYVVLGQDGLVNQWPEPPTPLMFQRATIPALDGGVLQRPVAQRPSILRPQVRVSS